MIKGFYAIVHAMTDYHIGHPHKHKYNEAVAKMLAGTAPDENDMHVIIQGVAMCGMFDTFDLQEAVDAINERFDTFYTANMKVDAHG